jgi:hypothetical protein
MQYLREGCVLKDEKDETRGSRVLLIPRFGFSKEVLEIPRSLDGDDCSGSEEQQASEGEDNDPND